MLRLFTTGRGQRLSSSTFKAVASSSSSGANTTTPSQEAAVSATSPQQQQPQQLSVAECSLAVLSCSVRLQSTTTSSTSASSSSPSSSAVPTGSIKSDGSSNIKNDEEELVHVLGTQPRHVARRVRQMMATSRRRLSHFRNTVTYLMIVLQGKLQKNEIKPDDAAIVVEGILQECVDLGQSDMAHLLFRAALRFRKYGVPVSPKCVHSLYRSFKEPQVTKGQRIREEEMKKQREYNNNNNNNNNNRQENDDGTLSAGGGTGGDGTAKGSSMQSSSSSSSFSASSASSDSRRGLLAQLAQEMKGQDDLRGLTIAALIYAGQIDEAKRMHASIPPKQLTSDDFCTMIQAYGNVGAHTEVGELVDEAVKSGTSEDFDLAPVYSAAIAVCGAAALHNNMKQMYRRQADDDSNSNNGGGFSVVSLMDSLMAEALQNGCAPSDAAVGAVMRVRLFNTRTLEEALAVESDLRHQLKSDELGLPATTAFVLRCSDFASQAAAQTNRGMGRKVDQLQEIVTQYIDNGEADRIEHSYAMALVRGFGALGHFDKMCAALEQLKAHTSLVDFKVYDECMRWLSTSGNVKLLLSVKQQMEDDHVYHSTLTYVSLLRGLGRFYPRLTHKYIEEARKALPFFDERLYGQVVNSYATMGDTEKVRQIYNEMLDKDSKGRRCFSPLSVSQLLYSVGSQAAPPSSHYSSRAAGRGAKQQRGQQQQGRNSGSDLGGGGDPVATQIFDQLVELASSRGMVSQQIVQRAVIAGYSEQKRAGELQRFVAQLPRKSPALYVTLLTAYGRLDDTQGFDKVLDEMKAARVPFTDSVFSVAAEICAQWHDQGRFKRVVELAKSAADSSRLGFVTSKNPKTVGRLARAHHMMGDWETVVALWRDLMRSSSAAAAAGASSSNAGSNKNSIENSSQSDHLDAENGGGPATIIPMQVFNKFLELAVRRNDLAFAHEVLAVMIARVPANPVTTTTVMDMLARMGRLHEVEVLLDEMARTKNIQPTIVTYHHAMAAFAKVGDVNKLVLLRDRVRAAGLRENSVTHNIMLSGFGRAQRFDAIPDLLNERASQGIFVDTNCYEILLDIYAKARMVNELENTVQAILKRAATIEVKRNAYAAAMAAKKAKTMGSNKDQNSSSSSSLSPLASSLEAAAAVAESKSASGGASSASDFPSDTQDIATVLGGAEHPTLTPRLLAAIATAYSHVTDIQNVEKYVSMLLANPRCRQTHVETAFLIYHRLRDNAKLDMLLAKYGGGSEFVLNICISAFAKAGMHDRVSAILHELQDRGWALHTNTAVVLSSLLLKAGKVELAQTVLKFRRVTEAKQLKRGEAAVTSEEEEATDASTEATTVRSNLAAEAFR